MAEAKMLTIEDIIFGAKERKSLDKDSKQKDELVISCLRSLAMDAVQQANSGHPGTPMAMAPVAYALWARILNYDPDSPQWMNRDRFVLSMGHASMLLYGLLHVAGVKEMTQEGHSTEKMAVSLDDIRNFRQLGSRCPGHPEFGETGGVEMTTGPLGQGVATSVGMAMASKWFASNFNKPDFPLFGFDVFALAGDGCLQEGVSAEAASLAGHLKLNNLCWIWVSSSSQERVSGLCATPMMGPQEMEGSREMTRSEDMERSRSRNLQRELQAAKSQALVPVTRRPPQQHGPYPSTLSVPPSVYEQMTTLQQELRDARDLPERSNESRPPRHMRPAQAVDDLIPDSQSGPPQQDNNQITIEGNTAWAISEDIPTRFIAYGWNVLRVGDANDVEALTRAFLAFRREQERPTLIVVDSHIAWGAPTKQDSFHAHGTPLGEKEVAATKHIYNWPNEKFLVPNEVKEHLRQQMAQRGGCNCQQWEKMLEEYKTQYPEEGKLLQNLLDGRLPDNWDRFFESFPADPKGLATRQSSSACLNYVSKGMPWLLGGSADLANSCLTTLKDAEDFLPPASRWGHYRGRNLHFGIREHAMGSVMNGLALCKLRPFGSTFLVFSDYMRPPIRMAAIMEVPSIFIFTHDSIGVGEDGPTHQPVEQLCSLRCIPGLSVFRPADANECVEMWKHIVPLQDEPVAVVLSRQALPTLDRQKFSSASGLHRGGYILHDSSSSCPDLILMASGSEAHEVLSQQGVNVRSVSMPCLELFKMQPQDYIDEVLPRQCRARVSIEAGRHHSWGSLIGIDGEHVGMISFGASGPSKRVQEEYGFTKQAVVNAANRVMSGRPQEMSTRALGLLSWKKRRLSK